jgi:hypothetical protein
MRQRLKTIEAYKAIKDVFDTNFLNEIIEKIIKKRQQEFFDDSNQSTQKRQRNRQMMMKNFDSTT